MKRNNYYPVRQGQQVIWLTNFNLKLPPYAATLGLSAGQVAAATADAAWLIYVLQDWLPGVRAWTLACTDAATAAQTGTGSDPQELPLFSPPDLPGGIIAVKPGALTRIFGLVQLIKDNPKYTEAIGTDLGIVGSEQTAPDLTTLQPVISATVSGNVVNIKWGWGGNAAFLDSCEIQVDRGDGKGFVLLTIDTTPNYTDTQPFPGAFTRWTYKAIYRVNDSQVGLWSQPVSVTVPA